MKINGTQLTSGCPFQVLQITSVCPNCGLAFETDYPGVLSVRGGGFYADFQPDYLIPTHAPRDEDPAQSDTGSLQTSYSEPSHAIWETFLFMCPKCGYVTCGPRSSRDPTIPRKEIRKLTSFVERFKPRGNARPSELSKYEVYAKQLQAERAEDHLIADQILRASWSARLRRDTKKANRLRSAALVRYREALLTTAKEATEDELIVRYLLVELDRLRGQEGHSMLAYEELLKLQGESIQGDHLIDVARRQFENPREDVVMVGSAGTMDYLGHYRATALLRYGYVALRNNDLPQAAKLFQRVLGFCEGPLRTQLTIGKNDYLLKFYSPLDQHGTHAAIGLREAWLRQGATESEELMRLDSLVRRVERMSNVSASEICKHNILTYELPPKPGWRYISRKAKDPKPKGRHVSAEDETVKAAMKIIREASKNRDSSIPNISIGSRDIAGPVKESISEAMGYCDQGAYGAAGRLAEEVTTLCSEEIESLDPYTSNHLELAGLKLSAQKIVAMSRLTQAEELESTIRYIEGALGAYHIVGGPKTNMTFAFLLSLLALAYERKSKVETAQEAIDKALQLCRNDPVDMFHLGRELSGFQPARTVAELILNRALGEGTKEKIWVEGAAAFLLAELYVQRGETRKASGLLKRAVLNDFIHTPGLWRHNFVKKHVPEVLKWAEQYYESGAGRNQLRPWWSDKRTEGSSSCAGCRRSLPYTPSDNVLTISAEVIHEWLRTTGPAGLACDKCRVVFGACCWNWHTYDDYIYFEEPHYVPLCPRCGNPLRGEVEGAVPVS